jgi:ribosome-associated protein
VTGDSALRVSSELVIPRAELTFRASRAGGPGGQHVNTSSTRAEVLWNLHRSRAVSDEQRARLRGKLSSRLDSDGNLRVVASSYRSQTRNREAAESRLAELLRRALIIPKRRRKTRPTAASVESRLREKRLRSEKKTHRRRHIDDV